MTTDDLRAYALAGILVLSGLIMLVYGPIAREYRRQFPVKTFSVWITQGGFQCEYIMTPDGYGETTPRLVDPTCGQRRKR